MKKFNTLEEAQQELTENRSEYLKNSYDFCPIARQTCNTKCASWVGPYARDGKNVYPRFEGVDIVYGHCCSPLITGEVYIQNMPM